MSDQLENFIRNNRENLDQQTPGSDLWNNIQNGLAQNAAGATAASTATASKAGFAAKLAQLSSAWKLTIAAFAVLAVCGTIYLASSGGNNGATPGTVTAETTPPPPGNGPDLPVAAVSLLVNPPLAEADVKYKSFTIDARKGGSWTAPTGTVIEVPKGIFVDADGKKVKGDVEIRYREFHDACDVILSGITMKYDNDGTEEDFQTAGMMEILGSQAGAPVYIAEGKSLEIKMASFTEEDDYNLYFLDPVKGWEDIGKADLGSNQDKKRGVQQVANLGEAPREPVLATVKDGGIGLQVDYKEFPELKPFKNLKWKAIDEKYAEENEWALTKTWSSVKLEEIDPENLEYRLVFGHRKGKFELDVTPMFAEGDHAKEMARFEKKLERYEKIKKNRKQKLALLNAQADLRRSFLITGFGIYNCDRYFRSSLTVTLDLDLQLPMDAVLADQEMQFFHITGDNRSVMPYRMKDLAQFKFFPQEKNYLVMLLPDQTAGVVKPKTFTALGSNFDHGQKVSLEVQQVARKIDNAGDLRLALGI